jgi:hypothetical protein
MAPARSASFALQTSPPIALRRDRLQLVLPKLLTGEQHCIRGDRAVAIRHDGPKPGTIARAHGYANVGGNQCLRLRRNANAILVWSHMKRSGTVKRPLASNESLQGRVEADLFKIKKNRRLVRSFFKSPDAPIFLTGE